MRRITISGLIIFLLLAVAACAKKEGPTGPYLAKAGNATITQADLEREMKNLPEFAQALFAGSGGKEKFLNELVKKEILYQEAVKKGFDKDPEYLKKLEDYKKITLIGSLLEKEIEAKSKVTEKDTKDYYDKHKEEISSVSQIKASHILVKTEDEAKKIYESLKKGANFAELAKKNSIDPGSAKNGGDLGFFSKGQMVPEFEAAAAKLRVGEISQPVKTKYGYHIIKVADKKLGKPIEFDKVKGVISQRVAAEKQKEAFDSYLENLKKSYKVEINKDAVSKLSAGGEKKEIPQVKPEQAGEPKESPKPEPKEKSGK
jgi:parvulin-like peptidyl-prolyl isomerase